MRARIAAKDEARLARATIRECIGNALSHDEVVMGLWYRPCWTRTPSSSSTTRPMSSSCAHACEPAWKKGSDSISVHSWIPTAAL